MAAQDGVAGIGAGNIAPGKSTTYEFDASPFGLHLYHCHTMPLAEHIAKGLYGAFIIDPKQGRPQADELVMVMNGFDTNFDRSNEVYAVNTVAFEYLHRPVKVKRGELVRIYLVNALEFDLLNSFHVHANFFDYYPTGHEARAARLHGHGDPGPGRARHPRAALPVHRQVHVPRTRERVRGARLDGVLPGRGVMEPATTAQATRRPAWLVGLAPLAVLAVAIGLFVLLDAPGLDRIGVPQEELAVERTVLKPGEIQLHVRNDGADPVQVRQVIVNDAFAAFSQSDDEIGRLGGSEIDVDYPWIEGENYDVTLLTATGATIDHTIEAAVETPDAGLDFYGLMALIGIYVGVIPVAIGMLWLPWIRGIDRRWIGFLLAFTVGLLGFLGVEALLEGTEIAGTGAEAFGGAALVWLGAAGAFLALAGVDAWLRGRRGAADGGGGGVAAAGYRAAFLVALGIGLHNLGEGLAIGSAYAVGSLALGATLVVGFALHNTTEGLAIVAPVAQERQASLRRLALLGLLAGAPAVLGAWIGASAYNPSLAALMFGIGAGAIAQVVVQIAPAIRDGAGRLLHPLAVGGLLTGLAVMYVTGLMVSL